MRPIRSAAVPISRRSFLVGGASALVVAACSGDDDDEAAPASSSSTTTPAPTTTTAPAVALAADPFGLGVASGDPDETGVVLWTRLLGAEGDHDVIWEVDEVGAGVVRATPDDAHAVHVVVDGLEPGRWYDYRFRTGPFTSPTGRTRAAGGDELRFAFASCQDWQDGHYTSHAHLAEEDVDLVVFLGDYIYEGGVSEAAVRPHTSEACTTLDMYRARYALYKSDLNLQTAHTSAPWFAVWDDHEVQNNDTGGTADPARRAAAYQAWWEHTATRLPRPEGGALEIHRTLTWGGLATFFGLDGRQHRDDQACDVDGDLGAACPERDDPNRTMLGAAQEAWLTDGLASSATTWNVLANQTIFSPASVPLGDVEIMNLDQWDGYPAARERALTSIAAADNVVIVTGDIHASAVNDVRRGDDVVAVELVGPGLSSSFPAQYANIFEIAAEAAGAAMVDAHHNGYVVCEVTRRHLTATYRYVDTVLAPTAAISSATEWRIDAGTPGVKPLA
jgi:alkaline phosphatase D